MRVNTFNRYDSTAKVYQYEPLTDVSTFEAEVNIHISRSSTVGTISFYSRTYIQEGRVLDELRDRNNNLLYPGLLQNGRQYLIESTTPEIDSIGSRFGWHYFAREI